MEKSTKLALGVFIKLPIAGRVKTRLAATVGAEKAAALYSRMLELVISRTLLPLDAEQFQVVFLCDPFAPLADYRAKFSGPFTFKEQRGQDLGERLANAFTDLLQTHTGAIVIGSDCVDIEPQHINETAQHLKRGELVLGPATDGGYYLIATTQPHPELFQNVAWSTNQVLGTTLKRAAAKRLRVHQLPPLSDIDTAEDLSATLGER